RSEFLSDKYALFGWRAKKRAPPPKKGSKYRLKDGGTKGRMSFRRLRLPPGHFRRGGPLTSCCSACVPRLPAMRRALFYRPILLNTIALSVSVRIAAAPLDPRESALGSADAVAKPICG